MTEYAASLHVGLHLHDDLLQELKEGPWASLHVGLHLHDDLLQELKWVR